MFSASMLKRIIIADLGEVVVAEIGVAALAIVQLVTNRIVVVALDANNAFIAQQIQTAVGLWSEAAKIAQAVDRIDAPMSSIADRDCQSQAGTEVL